jgi:hypothetical protein
MVGAFHPFPITQGSVVEIGWVAGQYHHALHGLESFQQRDMPRLIQFAAVAGFRTGGGNIRRIDEEQQ